MAYQVTRILTDKFAPGESKHLAKSSGENEDFIFSFNAMKTYTREAINFCNWCKMKYHARTVEDCRPHIREYLDTIRKKDGGRFSPSSLATKAAAIAKLYGISKIKTPKRTIKGYTRSRRAREMDKHYQPDNHQDLERFCRATGLRRCEVSRIRGTQLVVRDGYLFIDIIGNQAKGGRPRQVPVISDADFVRDIMSKSGSNKVFGKIPSACDVHAMRADYAAKLYKQVCRPLEICFSDPFYDKKRGVMSENSVYICRGSRRGVWYDKKALLTVSRALGHNRIDVVACHYLYSLDEEIRNMPTQIKDGQSCTTFLQP